MRDWATPTMADRLPHIASGPARHSAYGMQGRIEAHLLEHTQLLFEEFRHLTKTGNAESIHRIRRISRRLRVGLQFFRDLFPPSELKQVQRQLRRITRILGDIRTLDVNVRLLRRASRHLPPSTAAARAAWTHHFLRERGKQSAQLRELMQILEVGKLEPRVRATITTRNCHLHARRLLQSSNDQLNHLRRALRKRYKQFHKKETDTAFQKLRIAARRYRYGLEVCQAVFHTAVGGRIRVLEELQDLMGDCNDIKVLIDCLRNNREGGNNADKNLADSIDLMVKAFRNEEKQKFSLFERRLAEQRGWLKKIKLAAKQD